jgi:glycosyltransferase involved in cell wall biosynthesis
MPTYNRAHSIQDAIKSVLHQSFGDFELIIIDDGSTDNTEEIIKGIDDSRIVYQKVDHKGANFARNVGIKLAKYDLIGFQDSDDFWFTDKLLKQVKEAQKLSSKYAGVFCGFYRENSKGIKTYFPESKPDEDNLYYQLLKGNLIGTPSLVLKKKILEDIGLFDEKIPRFQDWELVLRIAKKYRIKYIDEPLFEAFNNRNNISKDVISGYVATKKIYQDHYSVIKNDKASMAWYAYTLGLFCLQLKKPKKARDYFKICIVNDCLQWKPWIRVFSTFLIFHKK